MGDLCVKTDVHNRLQDLSTDYDTLLDELCTEASQIFHTETGRRFDKTTATRYFSGTGRRTLFVPDLAALTSVRVRTNAQSAWRSLTLTPVEGDRAGDVLLGPQDRASGDPAGFLKIIDAVIGSDSVWPNGSATVEIAGDWGHATVPTDVKDACVELVVAMLRDRGVMPSGGGDREAYFTPDGRIRTYPDLTYRVMQRRRALLAA